MSETSAVGELMNDANDEYFTHAMKDYARFVDNGVTMPIEGTRERLGLGALGLNTEAGEAGDILKKNIYHGVELDREGLVKELGDVLWYFQLIVNTTDITWDEIIEGNVMKLVHRYPDKHLDPDA